MTQEKRTLMAKIHIASTKVEIKKVARPNDIVTEKTNKSRQNLIKKIHIAKKQLNYDDATYRDVLERVTGKVSCKEMDLKELKKVIMELKRLGFVPVPTATTKSKTPTWGKKPDGADEKKALIGKIEAMLADLNLHWAYADGMAKRMFGVDKAQWLNPKNLYKLTQALAVHQQKQAKKT